MIDGIYLGIVIAVFGLCALFAHSHSLTSM